MSEYEKRMVGLTVAIAVISAIYAFFAAAQWRAMDRALEVTQRAYVSVGDFIPDYANGSINVPVENSGHVPATNVRVTVYEARVRRPGETVIEHHSLGPEAGREIAPGTGRVSSNVDLGRWTPADMADVQAGRQTIIIGGRIRYNNGFGPDEYRYCRQTRLNTTLSAVVWIDCPPTVLKQLETINSQQKPQEKKGGVRLH